MQKLKSDIVAVCKLLYDKGLLVSTDGNASIRLDENHMLITASGLCKGTLTVDDITLTDLEGNIISGKKPARDIRMHIAAYNARPDIKAVVHAHPPITTGFSMSGYKLDKLSLPEVLFTLGDIATTQYCTPTTIEVPREITRVMAEKPNANAVLLSGHGALTVGADIFDAFYKMETLEMFFKASLVSKIIGNTYYLSDEEKEKAYRLFRGEDPDTVVSP